MSLVILLDAGPLGLITNPRASQEARECNQWLEALALKEIQVKIPEIADYEVRRELLRADKSKGVQRLNDLQRYLDYVPLTTQTMLKAAQFWAQVRKQGRPTADDKALDGDVILAAQAILIQDEGHEVIIATTNVGHLSRLAQAKTWREIG
jgi:predicted nucleic acid-binding protein